MTISAIVWSPNPPPLSGMDVTLSVDVTHDAASPTDRIDFAVYDLAYTPVAGTTVTVNITGMPNGVATAGPFTIPAGTYYGLAVANHSGSYMQYSSANFTVTAPTAPTITSPSAFTVPEGAGTACTVVATGSSPMVYAITGGADSSLVTMNASTGQVTFNTLPVFASPIDAGANNTYAFDVSVSNGVGSPATQSIVVTVTSTGGTAPIPGDGAKFSAALKAQLAGMSPSAAATALMTVMANWTFVLYRNGSVIASHGGSSPTACIASPAQPSSVEDGIIISGTATGATAGLAGSGSWAARVLSTADPTKYVDLDVSQRGLDGWIRSDVSGGDSIDYLLAIRAWAPKVAGSFPISFGPNKQGGVAQTPLPYIDECTPGAVVTSQPIAFYDVAGRWTSLKWPGIGGYAVSVSKNGGAFVLLDATTPSISISEGDVFQFRMTVSASYCVDQSWDLWLDGPINPIAPAAFNLASFWTITRNNDRAPQTFTVGPGQTHTQPQTAMALAREGDTIELIGGNDYNGIDVTRWGSAAAPITIKTRTGDATRARLNGAATGVYGKELAASAPYPAYKFTVWGGRNVGHIVFDNIEFSGTRNVPNTEIESIALRQTGRDWTIKNCYVHDFDMGLFSDDYHTGSVEIQLNTIVNCGRMATYNGHSIYLNVSSGAWPDDNTLVENNAILNAHGQGIASRTSRLIVRNNWIRMNSNVPNAGYAAIPSLGDGTGGEFCVSPAGHEREESNTYYRRPFVQIYGNVLIGGVSTGIVGAGGDTAGFNPLSNTLIAHNTIIGPSSPNIYLSIFPSKQTPHAVVWANNAVMHYGGAAYALEAVFAEQNVPATHPTYYLEWNNALPTGAGSYPGITAKMNTQGRVFHTGLPVTSLTSGSINVTPAGGSVLIGAACSLASLPTVAALHSSAPAIDLTRRVWATEPTAGAVLTVPTPGAALTNIGAL